MPDEWDLTRSTLLGRYRIFDLHEDLRTHPERGTTHTFYRMESSDWVNVVALTPAEEVVLVRQFRAGIRAPALEIPGGIIDPGETPLKAGLRELEEETGYAAEAAAPLGVVHPNPALLSNRCHTILARGVRPTGQRRLDDGESIRVEHAPLAEIPDYIARGAITHALVVAAFYWFFMKDRES